MNTINTKIYVVRPSERNNLRENRVVLSKHDLAHVSFIIFFLQPCEVMSTRVFYSSSSGSYNESQGPTGGLGAGKSLRDRAPVARSSI
jgi:hypothetical protein